MLPWRKTTGKNAYKNLRVFVGVPEELDMKGVKPIVLKEANLNKLNVPKHITLKDLSFYLGAKV